MERAVFYIAIVIAAFVALGAIFGEDLHINGKAHFFDHDPVVAVKAESLAERSFAAERVTIKAAAIRLVIVPEERADIAVTVENPGALPTPEVSLDNGRLVIDGRLAGRLHDCGETIDVDGYGAVARDSMPLVTVRAPMAVVLRVNSSGPTQIGPAQSVEAAFTGCGGADIADVAGALKLDLSGAGAVNAGAAGSLDLDSAGSADAVIGAVSGGAVISIAGSGNVDVAALTGDLELDAAGSGGVTIKGGAINRAEISLAGADEVTIAANIEQLEAAIAGSGSVAVDGEVGELEASIMGSGDVSARKVRGRVERNVMGSGEVRIGQ